LSFPAQLYLEGSDQHRGWFQSSLIPSMAIDKVAPFTAVLTHGFVVDGEGRKMSKSLGNVISPQEVIKEYGADILRLWVASSDYNEDIRISGQILSRLTEAYRKIRNTSRFILSNLFDFSPDKDKLDYQELKLIDKWILFQLEKMREAVSSAYENFEFHRAYKGIYDFCNEELSMHYLDMVKGRLYTYPASLPARRAAQTAIYECLSYLVRLMAPILTFTAEEIWKYMPKEKSFLGIQSIHLADWPQPNPIFAQSALSKGQKDVGSQLELIFEILEEIAKFLEEKRSSGIIGSSFDAQIILLTNKDFHYKYLESILEDLPEIFKVSSVKIEKDIGEAGALPLEKYPDIRLLVKKADGKKCARCWNYSLSVGTNDEHKALCARCIQAIELIKEER